MNDEFWDSYLQQKVDAQAKFSTMDPALKPDGAARSFQLQGFSGVPAETIGGEPKEFDDRYQNELRQNLVASNPHLTDFVNSHPLHAQLIKDDLPTLDRLTNTTAQIARRQSSDDRVKQFVQNFKVNNPDHGYGPILDPLIEGLFHFEQSMRRSGAVLAGSRQSQQVEESPYAAPYEWGDLSSLNTTYAKTAYRLANAFPSAAIGLGVMGITANPLAGIVAGGLSVGVLSGIQTIGDEFQRELSKTPEDPEGAYNRALTSAGTQGVFSGVSWGLFPIRFLNGPVKSMLFQIFGVQPAVGAANRLVQGYQQGVQPNLGEGYAEDVVGSLLPLLLFEGVRGGRYAIRPGTPFRPYTEGGPGFEITPPGGPGPRPQPSGLLEPASTEGLVLPEGMTDMSRRGFLQGLGAIAARTALPINQPRGWQHLLSEVHPAALDFAEEFMTDMHGRPYVLTEGGAQSSFGVQSQYPIVTREYAAKAMREMADWYAAQPDRSWDKFGLWEAHNFSKQDLVQAHLDAARLIDAGYDALQASARAMARLATMNKAPVDIWRPQDQQQVLVEGQQADENKQIIDAAVKDAEKTQLKAMAPEKLNELMGQLPSQSLHIRADAIAKLYKELIKEPNQYVQDLVKKFTASNGMLSHITTDSTKYIANVPAEIHKALSDHIALGNDMAPSEVKELEKGIQPRPPEEHVFLPAVQVKGQMFEDHDHAGAYDQATKALEGVQVDPQEIQEGYSTTHGRFITPQEAFQISKERGQLRENAVSTDALAPGDLRVVGPRAQALQLGRDIRDEIVQTFGLDEKLAKEYGDLIAAYYYRRAVDTGMDPRFLYESDGLSFRWGDGDNLTIVGAPFAQATLRGFRGQITIDARLALIELFKERFTVDTLAHEFYHLWIYNVFRDAMRPGASTKSVDLRDDLLEFLKHPRGSIVDPDLLSEGDHELAADAGLAYLREGNAPSLALAKVFESFRDSLTGIYRDASTLGLPLDDSIRSFFQRIIATDEEIRRVTAPEQSTLDIIRQSSGLDSVHLPDLPYQEGQRLEALVKNPATTWQQLAESPLIQEWEAHRSSIIPTATIQQARDPNWRVRRTYVLDGKSYGGDNILDPLMDKTAEAAGGPEAIRQERTLIIIVGPPGAGKSTVDKPIAEQFGARIIDVDDVRTVIPEYKGGEGLFATLAEGQALTLELMIRALKRGDNIVHPIVGANPTDNIKNILNNLDRFEPEVVTEPAFRYAGQIYTGEIHSIAVEKAAEEHDIDTDDFYDNYLRPEDEGFMTNKGRFVSRLEAFDIGKAANQLVYSRPPRRPLDSGMLKAPEEEGYGYKLKVLHLWADPNELGRRIASRFIETGRIVKLEYAAKAAENSPQTYEGLKPYANEAASFDTTNAIWNRRTKSWDVPPRIQDGEGTTFADIVRRGSGGAPGADVSGLLPERAGTQTQPTKGADQQTGVGRRWLQDPSRLPRVLRQDEDDYQDQIQQERMRLVVEIRQELQRLLPGSKNIEQYVGSATMLTQPRETLWRMIRMTAPVEIKASLPTEMPPELKLLFERAQSLLSERNRGMFGEGGPRRLQQPPVPPVNPPTPPADGEGGNTSPPTPPSPPFLTGAVFGRTQRMYRQYLRMIHQRDMEDVVWRRNRAQKLAERLNSKEWEETVNRIMPGIRIEVENLPEVAAFQALTKRDAKIARGSLTPDQIAMLPRTWIAADGIAINDLANYYGYDLGEELVEVLAAMRRATEGFTGNIVTRMTKARTYQQAMEELGDTAQSRLDEVEDHALSLTQMEMLHERMLAVGIQAGAPLPLSKSAGDWAIFEGFQASPFRNLKADRFLREAGKQGRAIEQAQLNGDILGAFRAAQAQYVATQMAKLAKTVESEIRAFKKVAKHFRTREVAKVDVRFTNFIHDILIRASGGVVRREPDDLYREIAAQHSDEEQTLHGFLTQMQAQGNYIPVPDFLLDPNWSGDIQDMNIRDARRVMNAVRMLAKVGRDLDRVVVAGERRELNEVVNSLIEQLGTLGPGVTRSRFRSSSLHEFLAMHLQMESLFNRWAYGRAFGEFNQVLRPMIEAANEEAALDRQVSEAYRNLPDRLKSWELNATVKNNLFKNPIEAWEPIGSARGTNQDPNGWFNWTKPGISYLPLTKKNVRAILLNAGNPDNLQRFAAGFGLEQQQVMNWLFQNTTKEDWDWAQAHGKIFAKLKEESDAMYRDLNGVAPEAIPVYPIQTPYGVYEGWYHPVIHDEFFYGRWQEQQGVAGLFAKEYVRAATAQGYTKSRTGYRGPLSIELDAVPGRFWQEIHDISFRRAVMNTGKIFYDTRFRNQVMRQYGKEYSDMLVPWLEDVANTMAQNTVAQKGFKLWLDFFRENLMGTLIGFNLRTVQKHATTALANSVAEVGGKDFLQAAVSMWGTSPGRQVSNWNFAIENSLELQRRHQSFLEHISGAQSAALGTRAGPLQKIASKFGAPSLGFNLEQFRKMMLQYGTTPVAFSDLLSAVPVWLAAYKQIMEGRNEEYNNYIRSKGITGPRPGDAVYFADRAVRRAHGSTAVTNRPWVMREGMGPFGKYLATFYSFFNHIANRHYELAWRARVASGNSTDQEAIDAVKEGTNFWFLFFAYVVVVAAVEELVTPMTDSDKMSWGELVAKSLILGLSSSWIGVRDLVHSLLEGNDANLGLGGVPVKAAQSTYRDLNYRGYDPAHTGKEIKRFNTLIGVGTGLSNTEIGNMMEYIYDLNKGNAHPRTGGDWWRGLTKGEEHPREDRPDMVERFMRAIGKDKSWK